MAGELHTSPAFSSSIQADRPCRCSVVCLVKCSGLLLCCTQPSLTYPVVSSGIEQSSEATCAALRRCCPASVLVIVYPKDWPGLLWTVLMHLVLSFVCRVQMPPSIPLTTQVMRDDQAYLLDNGRSLCLWIGRSIRPDFIQQVSRATEKLWCALLTRTLCNHVHLEWLLHQAWICS